MAKKQQKEKSIEETLWDSANKLRGSVEPSEYKHVVLSLIFLKYSYDRFVERRNELIADGKEAFVEQPVFYNAKNVFYLNEVSRWEYLIENAKQNDIAIKIDTALAQVEKDNPTLKGALPSNYYSGLGLDRTKLASLLDVIAKIDTQKDKEHDLIGRVYEYFLGKFAIAEGKGDLSQVSSAEKCSSHIQCLCQGCQSHERDVPTFQFCSQIYDRELCSP